VKEKASARSIRNDRGVRRFRRRGRKREPCGFTGGANGDLDVLAEGGEKFPETGLESTVWVGSLRWSRTTRANQLLPPLLTWGGSCPPWREVFGLALPLHAFHSC